MVDKGERKEGRTQEGRREIEFKGMAGRGFHVCLFACVFWFSEMSSY